MLPDLIISSKVSGVVHVNDRVLGEVSSHAYQSFIGAGSFYLSFSPLEYSECYGQFTVKIQIENGAPIFNCPYITSIDFGKGAFYLDINPPVLVGNTLPQCLAYEHFNDRFTASLMSQCGYYLVVEDESQQLPDGFFPLELVGDNPALEQGEVGGITMLLVCDMVEHLYIFIYSEQGFSLSNSLDADGVTMNGDAIIVKRTTTFGHVLKNTYSLVEGKLVLTHSEYEDAGSVNSTNDVAIDFLECVKYGIESRATAYLAPDLPLSFEELQEFLGEFTEIKASPFEEGAFALISKNSAARFAFELSGNKISNIEEL